MSTREQRKFLESQVFNMTLAATVQRSGMYKTGLQESQREPLRESLRAALVSIAATYKKEVAEQQHNRNIARLATTITRKHSAILAGKRMKIGHAQKALNLYLKYLWCLGWLPRPPHCPLDSVILKKVPGFSQERWTHLDSITKYKRIIAAAKKKAEGATPKRSLAAWELERYNHDSA